MVSKDDMGRFEQEEMKIIRPIKNTLYDWSINYIRQPVRKTVSVLKDKFINLLRQIHLNKLLMGEDRN